MPMFKKTISSVVKNPKVLDFSFIPEHLPHREKQMKRLSALFSPVLDHRISQNAFFNGPVGTGKTSLAHRFCLDFIDAGKGTKAIRYKIINCRDKRSTTKVIHEIVKTFQPVFSRGYSTTEMLEIFRKDLKKRNIHFIIVLDEVDILINNDGGKIIYYLTRFDEEKASVSGSLSLIMISTRNVLDNLDTATMSTFKRSNIIRFGRYSKEELLDIVDQRVRIGLHPQTISPAGKETIAKMAAEKGDARKAIELLQVAAAYADEEHMKRIGIDHIRKAKSHVSKVDVEPFINSLNTKRMIALLAIARALQRKTTITMGEAEKSYLVVCEEAGQKPRGHTQFWTYVKELNSMGIIEAERSGRGHQGNTTIISMHELPAKVLIKILEERICED